MHKIRDKTIKVCSDFYLLSFKTIDNNQSKYEILKVYLKYTYSN